MERTGALRQRSPRKAPDRVPRDALAARSGGRCEAWWLEIGVRCPRQAVDPQHRITKARGGQLLDDTGSLFHLAHLCRACHRRADNGPAGRPRCEGYALIDGNLEPLLAAGEVRTRIDGTPFYIGPDPGFIARYPREQA